MGAHERPGTSISTLVSRLDNNAEKHFELPTKKLTSLGLMVHCCAISC